MPYILAYIFKFSISVGVLYIFYRFVLRPLTFYQWNRFYLGGYALLSFAIPFIDITPWINERDRENSGLLQAIPAIGNVDLLFASGTDFWWAMIIKEKWSLVLLVIVIGSLVMVAKLLYQYLSLLMMKRNAVLVKTAAVNCYEVSGKITPFSFGNSIFINRDLHTAGELQKIMQHEFVHIKQKHSIDILIAETIVVINWFNPFAWLLRNAIRQNLEFIADSNVLQSGIDARQYQYLLLKVIGIPQYSITNHFNFSSLKKRIAMMNKMKTAKLHLVKFLFIVPLLALLLVAFRQRSAVSAQTGEIQALSILSNNTNDTVPRRPAPPPPPENSQTAIAPVLPLGPKQLPTNVNSITIATSSRAIVALKNGEEETYDLDKPEEKLSFEKSMASLFPRHHHLHHRLHPFL
ncbi:MAG: M56 family metallopeptidase [Chitinophagaceae bacterium]